MQLDEQINKLISMVTRSIAEIQAEIYMDRLQIEELQTVLEQLEKMKKQVPLSSDDVNQVSPKKSKQKGRKPGTKNKIPAKGRPTKRSNVTTIKKEVAKKDNPEIESVPVKKELNERELEIKAVVFPHESRFDDQGRVIYPKHEKGVYSNRQQSKYLDEVDKELNKPKK